MSIWGFIIPAVLILWIIFYQLFSKKWKALADKIKSKGLRNTIKAFLTLSYIVSIIAIVLGWVLRIASLFSSKGDKA